MKEIIPVKLITTLNKDGTVKDSILQYQISIDGAVENKFYTMGVKAGINITDLGKVITDSISHAATGEKIK